MMARVAAAIVVADMVGVGVFTSLGFQVKDIPSGFSILLLWTVGGVVALSDPVRGVPVREVKWTAARATRSSAG